MWNMFQNQSNNIQNNQINNMPNNQPIAKPTVQTEFNNTNTSNNQPIKLKRLLRVEYLEIHKL